jgi:hypothetical protein
MSVYERDISCVARRLFMRSAFVTLDSVPLILSETGQNFFRSRCCPVNETVARYPRSTVLCSSALPAVTTVSWGIAQCNDAAQSNIPARRVAVYPGQFWFACFIRYLVGGIRLPATVYIFVNMLCQLTKRTASQAFSDQNMCITVITNSNVSQLNEARHPHTQPGPVTPVLVVSPLFPRSPFPSNVLYGFLIPPCVLRVLLIPSARNMKWKWQIMSPSLGLRDFPPVPVIFICLGSEDTIKLYSHK